MFEVNEKVLDKLCEDFEKMNYKAGAWWPTVEEINTKIAPRITEKMPFAIWILETAEPPQTDEEKASRKLLSQLVYENVKYDEDDAEIEISLEKEKEKEKVKEKKSKNEKAKEEENEE